MKFLQFFLFLIILPTGCDSEGQNKEDSPRNEEAIGATATFSGYVQRAFTLEVDGAEFSDSEHFYTRFIDDLILSNPRYASLENAEIQVEGEYGLSKFGAFTPVFMSSEQAEGHLFESKTDKKGKFSIDVNASALDETFKAKIVLRIGLSITPSGEENATRYCYLLHSTKEGISVDQKSKPVIFNQFHTQLNKYNCSKYQGQIDIPIDIGDVQGDDPTEPEGNVVSLVSTKILDLGSKYNSLLGPSFSQKTSSFLIPLRVNERTIELVDLHDSLNGEARKKIVPNSKTRTHSEYFFSILNDREVFYSETGPSSNKSHIINFENDEILDYDFGYQAGVSPGNLDILSFENGRNMAIGHYWGSVKSTLCEFKFYQEENDSHYLSNCKELEGASGVRSATTGKNNLVYTLNRETRKILVFNLNGSLLKTYSLGQDDFYSDALNKSRIVGNSDKIYLVFLSGSKLYFQEIELN